MKVESNHDVQTLRPLDQAVISHTPVPAPAKGTDELAHLFAQEVAFNSRALSERTMGMRVLPTQQLSQLYDQLGHPAQESLASVSRRIRQQLQHEPTVEKLLELTGGDPARAFVVLKHVEAKADSEARQPEARLARDAIAKLETRFKGVIQAGLNIALALQLAAADPQERQGLRTLYYDTVVNRPSLGAMMKALLEEYGVERFHIGLNVMRKALADDIAAKVSSTPTHQLRNLLLGLQSCGQLSAVLAECEGVMKRLAIEHDPVGLLQRLLAYAGSGIESEEMLRLAKDLGGASFLRQLAVLKELYPVFQRMPLAWWSESDLRTQALALFVLAMDGLDLHLRGPKRLAGEPRPET